MAAKKIKETPDFVKGLLKSADEISNLLNPESMPPRALLMKLHDDEVRLEDLSSGERQELGMYQSRVVLMVLAAELALKFLWEQDKGKPAKPNHNVHQLFHGLSNSLQVEIQSEYCERAKSPPNGWETPERIFESCKNASVQWRYLVEKRNFPKYVMQAEYLKYATLSVLQLGKRFAQGKLGAMDSKSHP